MREFLQRPSPILISAQIKWGFSFGIALFVFVFLFTFRPFDIFTDLMISPLLAFMGFAGITFIFNLLFIFGWHAYFIGKWDVRWTVGLELASIFVHLTAIGVVNHFFILEIVNPDHFLGNSVILTFFQNMFFTYSIGFFPIVFVLTFFEMKWRTQHVSQSNMFPELNANIQDATSEVTINGDSSENQIELSSTTFLFARSSGNYVEYYSQVDGNIKKELQRITLAKLETALSESTFEYLKTHRSYIVNISAVKNVSGNAQGYSLEIDGTTQKVPVSRYHITEFDRVMNG